VWGITKKFLAYFLLLFLLGCENPNGTEAYVGIDFDPGNGNGIDIDPPSTPVLISITGTANSTTAKTLTWQASSDNNGVSYYEIALGSSNIGAGKTDIVDWTNISNVTSYQIRNGVDGMTINLSSGTLYYISVRAVDGAGNTSIESTTAFSYFQPTDFFGLAFWLSAQEISSLKQDGGCSVDVTAGGDPLNCILDLGLNGIDFTTNNGSPAYVANGINGFPAFELENNERMETPNNGLVNDGDRTEKTHYIVFRTDAEVASRQILYKEGGGTNGTAFYIEGGLLYVGAWIDNSGNASDRTWITYPVAANTNYIAGFSLNTAADSFTVSVNGDATSQQALAGQVLKSHTGNINIGAADTNIRLSDGSNNAPTDTVSLQGEHIMYDRALNGSQQEDIEGYLACKWGLQGSLIVSHSYRSDCP
tara:strand:+ start:30741 stop:32000 length:1260 start_codon:yes stop_codon:yes gene_type:complete